LKIGAEKYSSIATPITISDIERAQELVETLA